MNVKKKNKPLTKLKKDIKSDKITNQKKERENIYVRKIYKLIIKHNRHK